MKIGELAERSGCSIQTIRYYEKMQLLPVPSRSKGNFRLYKSDTLEHLKFIKRCRDLDLALTEIGLLMKIKAKPDLECDSVNRLIDTHLERVESKIAEFKQLKSQLVNLRDTCSNTHKAKYCGILKQLSKNQ